MRATSENIQDIILLKSANFVRIHIKVAAQCAKEHTQPGYAFFARKSDISIPFTAHSFCLASLLLKAYSSKGALVSVIPIAASISSYPSATILILSYHNSAVRD